MKKMLMTFLLFFVFIFDEIAFGNTIKQHGVEAITFGDIKPNEYMYVSTNLDTLIYSGEEDIAIFKNSDIDNFHILDLSTNKVQFYDIDFSVEDYNNETYVLQLPKSDINKRGELTLYLRESPSVNIKYDISHENVNASSFPSINIWLSDTDEAIWKFEFESYPGTTEWALLKYAKHINIPNTFSAFYFDDREPEYLNIIGSIDTRYRDNTNLIYAELGENVTSISERTFSGCSNLKSISIPNSITNIGIGAFENCESITNMIIPDSVTYLGSASFYNCRNLNSITILGNIVNDYNYALFGSWCTNLSTVILGGEMTRIGYGMFSGCKNLSNVIMSDSITSIADSAFASTTSLIDISLSNNITNIGAYAFGYGKLKTLTISDKIVSIAPGAFLLNKSLETVYCKKIITDDPITHIKELIRNSGINVDTINFIEID